MYAKIVNYLMICNIKVGFSGKMSGFLLIRLNNHIQINSKLFK